MGKDTAPPTRSELIERIKAAIESATYKQLFVALSTLEYNLEYK